VGLEGLEPGDVGWGCLLEYLSHPSSMSDIRAGSRSAVVPDTCPLIIALPGNSGSPEPDTVLPSYREIRLTNLFFINLISDMKIFLNESGTRVNRPLPRTYPGFVSI